MPRTASKLQSLGARFRLTFEKSPQLALEEVAGEIRRGGPSSRSSIEVETG